MVLLPLTLQISPTHNMHLNVPKLACLIGRGVPGTNAKLPILADAPTSTDRCIGIRSIKPKSKKVPVHNGKFLLLHASRYRLFTGAMLQACRAADWIPYGSRSRNSARSHGASL